MVEWCWRQQWPIIRKIFCPIVPNHLRSSQSPGIKWLTLTSALCCASLEKPKRHSGLNSAQCRWARSQRLGQSGKLMPIVPNCCMVVKSSRLWHLWLSAAENRKLHSLPTPEKLNLAVRVATLDGGHLGERRHCVESVSSESCSKLPVKWRNKACFCEPAQSLRNCSGSLWHVQSFPRALS